ncbi:ArfGAP with SH3 domain, ankyrin repeat and PH domain 3 [Blastocladiella emersonii ATCC 22665]|nr:ArfGAP with SH3 domain, ankyrin repeat and PH domain 3 [Blastocladiella emersonii ATCC 22665]
MPHRKDAYEPHFSVQLIRYARRDPGDGHSGLRWVDLKYGTPADSPHYPTVEIRPRARALLVRDLGNSSPPLLRSIESMHEIRDVGKKVGIEPISRKAVLQLREQLVVEAGEMAARLAALDAAVGEIDDCIAVGADVHEAVVERALDLLLPVMEQVEPGEASSLPLSRSAASDTSALGLSSSPSIDHHGGAAPTSPLTPIPAVGRIIIPPPATIAAPVPLHALPPLSPPLQPVSPPPPATSSPRLSVASHFKRLVKSRSANPAPASSSPLPGTITIPPSSPEAPGSGALDGLIGVTETNGVPVCALRVLLPEHPMVGSKGIHTLAHHTAKDVCALVLGKLGGESSHAAAAAVPAPADEYELYMAVDKDERVLQDTELPFWLIVEHIYKNVRFSLRKRVTSGVLRVFSCLHTAATTQVFTCVSATLATTAADVIASALPKLKVHGDPAGYTLVEHLGDQARALAPNEKPLATTIAYARRGLGDVVKLSLRAAASAGGAANTSSGGGIAHAGISVGPGASSEVVVTHHLVPDLAAGSSGACVDCDAPNATMVSVFFGSYLCRDCAAVHQSLADTPTARGTTHNPRIRLAKLPRWHWTVAQLLQDRGNKAANLFLEADLCNSARQKPGPTSDRASKREYISAKYLELAYAPAATRSLSPGSADLAHQLYYAVHGSDLHVVVTAIQAGADVDAVVDPETGRAALHLAASYGDAPIVEALLHAGASPCAADALGRTPLWYAWANKHAALAARIKDAQWLFHYARQRAPKQRFPGSASPTALRLTAMPAEQFDAQLVALNVEVVQRENAGRLRDQQRSMASLLDVISWDQLLGVPAAENPLRSPAAAAAATGGAGIALLPSGTTGVAYHALPSRLNSAAAAAARHHPAVAAAGLAGYAGDAFAIHTLPDAELVALLDAAIEEEGTRELVRVMERKCAAACEAGYENDAWMATLRAAQHREMEQAQRRASLVSE